jgi:hypothetical protein
MIQKNAVYRKSAHGAEALARRDPALTLRLRSLLILVDGKRHAEELAKLSPSGPETEQLLGQLDDLGMIELATAPAPAPATAAMAATAEAPAPAAVLTPEPAAAPTPVQVRVVPLPEAKRAAVRRITDLLGPTGEDLCLRIESTRSAQDLLAVLKRAEAVVRSVRGAEAATAFVHDMQAHQPG